MRKPFFFAMAAALALMSISAWGQKAPGPTRVAVLEFSVKGDIGLQGAGSVAAEWLSSALAASAKYQVLERVLLDKVLEEQSISVSGMIDEKSSAKIGQLFGAQAIATGSLVAWAGKVTMTAKIIDVGTGAVLKSATCQVPDLSALSARMKDVAGVLDGSMPTDFLADTAAFPGSKKRDDKAVSVVKATKRDGKLRLIIDRGELDRVAKGQAFSIMIPVFEKSEVSGSSVRTGWKRLGVVLISYVEPSYSAGDFLPELFVPVTEDVLVKEAVALPAPPVNMTLYAGALNVGGQMGFGIGSRNGIVSYFFGYETSQPSLFLTDAAGEILGVSYELPILGNAFSRSRITAGAAALGRLNFGSVDTPMMYGGGGAAFLGLTFGSIKIQLGARGMYMYGSSIDSNAVGGNRTISVRSIEPFITLAYEPSFFSGR